jgi:formylglycine-generating enzyme required for sulfatase activity
MHGNVEEWIHGGWGAKDYEPFAKTPATNLFALSFANSGRGVRGGAFDYGPVHAAERSVRDLNLRGRRQGFRVALSIEAVRQTVNRTGD